VGTMKANLSLSFSCKAVTGAVDINADLNVLSSSPGPDVTMALDGSSSHSDWDGPCSGMVLRYQHGLMVQTPGILMAFDGNRSCGHQCGLQLWQGYGPKIGSHHGPRKVEWICRFDSTEAFVLVSLSVVVTAFIYMVYYIDRLSYVEPSLHLWDKAYLVMVDNVFDVFLCGRDPRPARNNDHHTRILLVSRFIGEPLG
ncbi:hypothetical protein STEG23_000033, partial [Scotinomys teguina]